MKLKVLATTGLALTLGLTSIGTNVTPTHADEISSSNQGDIGVNITGGPLDSTGQKKAHDYKDYYSENNMFKFAPFDTTGFEITSQEKELKSIDYAINDNSGNPDASTRRSPTKSFSKTDSMTVNTSTELSVANEVSSSAGFPGIASVTAKFTAGFKFSAGFSKVTSETQSLTYGGDELVAKPNQILRVDYFLEELKTSGIINTGTRITEIGDVLRVHKVEKLAEHNFKSIESYKPGYKSGEQVYNEFKHIEEINRTNDIILGSDQGWSTVTFIPKGEFSKHFFIDDEAKTVSTVGTQGSFDGVSGTGLTSRTTVINPVTNAKTVVSEEQIQQP